jgi:chromosome partitioning protein
MIHAMGRARVVAVANQKGGVAKTTSVHSLGTALAERGLRTLLVDLDPQACLTWSTGKVNDLQLLPSTIDVAGAEVHLLSKTGREYVLRRALEPLMPEFDAVLIDCPPSLGICTINGLTAAAEVLIPLQCETLSQRGVGQLLETVDDVRAYTNEDLRVRGVIATMYDGRTKLASAVIGEVRERYGLEVIEPPVPKSIRVAEAPGLGRSVLTHAPTSKAAEAYRQLARAVFQ